MNELETKEAVKILLSEKKKAECELTKAYDSYCLFPNEHDQEDWNNYSALATALDMAIDALEKRIPKSPVNIEQGDDIGECPSCGISTYWHCDVFYCEKCGQAICWEVDEPDISIECYESGGK